MKITEDTEWRFSPPAAQALSQKCRKWVTKRQICATKPQKTRFKSHFIDTKIAFLDFAVMRVPHFL